MTGRKRERERLNSNPKKDYFTRFQAREYYRSI
jgi:hypothetical protein